MRSLLLFSPADQPILQELGINGPLDTVGVKTGVEIVASRTSFVRRITLQDGRAVFLKVYIYPELKRQWRYFGRLSRARSEFENLKTLRRLGVEAARPIACGEARGWIGNLHLSFLLTESVPDAVDLDHWPESDFASASNKRSHRLQVISNLATAVARMHRAGFVDGDLFFRNILISRSPQKPVVTMIDSPKGAIRRGRQLKRGQIDDLACLGRDAWPRFSRAEMARFLELWRRESGWVGGWRDTARMVLSRMAVLSERHRQKEERHAAQSPEADRRRREFAAVTFKKLASKQSKFLRTPDGTDG